MILYQRMPYPPNPWEKASNYCFNIWTVHAKYYYNNDEAHKILEELDV